MANYQKVYIPSIKKTMGMVKLKEPRANRNDLRKSTGGGCYPHASERWIMQSSGSPKIRGIKTGGVMPRSKNQEKIHRGGGGLEICRVVKKDGTRKITTGEERGFFRGEIGCFWRESPLSCNVLTVFWGLKAKKIFERLCQLAHLVGHEFLP